MIYRELLWEAEWRRNTLITLWQNHTHNAGKGCGGFFNPVSEGEIMWGNVLRAQKHLRWWGCSVAWLLAGYKDATPTNICSASQLAGDANRDLTPFGCWSVCAVNMKEKSTVAQLPPTRNLVLIQHKSLLLQWQSLFLHVSSEANCVYHQDWNLPCSQLLLFTSHGLIESNRF